MANEHASITNMHNFQRSVCEIREFARGFVSAASLGFVIYGGFYTILSIKKNIVYNEYGDIFFNISSRFCMKIVKNI